MSASTVHRPSEIRIAASAAVSLTVIACSTGECSWQADPVDAARVGQGGGRAEGDGADHGLFV
jgi:hypothetical protein